MKCVYCDSIIKNAPENGMCPNCGGRLPGQYQSIRGVQEKLRFPKPPIGRYRDAAGYLEIGEDSITFYQDHRPVYKETKRTIPYSELYAVSFAKGRFLQSGSLCVRSWQDRHLPLVKAAEAVLDETSVYFTEKENDTFEQIYTFLQHCAEIVKRANLLGDADPSMNILGKYKCYCGYLELGAHALTLYKKLLMMKPSIKTIPYSEIAEVAFREADGIRDGGISVRGTTEAKDLTKSLQQALVDENAIEFSKESNEAMKAVYAFLVEHVRMNTLRWTSEICE